MSKPRFFSFLFRIVWSKVSKAFLKSRNIAVVHLSWFKERYILFVNLLRLSMVLRAGLNPS